MATYLNELVGGRLVCTTNLLIERYLRIVTLDEPLLLGAAFLGLRHSVGSSQFDLSQLDVGHYLLQVGSRAFRKRKGARLSGIPLVTVRKLQAQIGIQALDRCRRPQRSRERDSPFSTS